MRRLRGDEMIVVAAFVVAALLVGVPLVLWLNAPPGY